MRSVLVVAASMLAVCSSVFAVAPPFISHWEASSGLTPDQVGYQLINTSVPETPTLSATHLTVFNDTVNETMFYRMADADLVMPGTLEIAFRMRFDSGTSSFIGRSPAGVFATTAPSVGASLYIGPDEIFLNSGSIYSRGPQNTSIDTDSAFHDYLLRVEGTAAGSAVSVFQDGTLVLSGASFSNTSDHGLVTRVTFGEATVHAYGTSEWESFTHNAAAIPEPTTFTLFTLGSLALIMASRRR